MKTLRLTLLTLVINQLSIINSNAQWVSNGPYGGSINCLATSGSNVFAGTIDNGVFLTTDNGATWTAVNNGLPYEVIINTLVVNGSNIYACTRGAGLFVTSDNGSSWTALNNGLPAGNVWVSSLAFNGSTMYASTWGSGVFVSTGGSWSRINTGLNDTMVDAMAISGSNLYAATQSGVFVSTNAGASWFTSNNGISDSLYLSAIVTSGSYIFVGTDGAGIYASDDNGANWTLANTGFTPSYVNTFVSSSYGLAACTNSGIYVTNNNGALWTPVSATLPLVNVYALTVNGANVFAGGGGGVYVANDFNNWTLQNNGITNQVVMSLAANGSYIYAATVQSGNFLSTDKGQSWAPVNNGLFTGFYPVALAISGTTVFAGSQQNGVFVSTDSGATWGNQQLFGTGVNAFTVNDTGIFAGTTEGVFLSTDLGGAWVQTSSYNLQLNGAQCMASNGRNIYAGTAFGGVFYSADNGNNWVQVNNNLPYNDFAVLSMAVSGNYVFAGTNGRGVYVSSDQGANWAQANTGLTDTFVTSLLVNGSTIFAGAYGGLYYTTDNGTNWLPVNTGIPDLQVQSLAIADTMLFAGTYGSSVWQEGLSAITGSGCTPPPPPVNNYPSGQPVCAGATAVAGVTGTGSITWYNAPAGGVIVHSGASFNTPVLDTTTTYYVQDSTCAASARTAITITVDPVPVPVITASSDTICPNDSAQICTGIFASYLWSTGDTIACTFVNEAGPYWVTVTDGNGCTAVSNQVSIEVYPEPAGPWIVIQNDTLASFDGVSYQWYFDSAIIQGATSGFYVVTQSGYYAVLLIDVNGCVIFSGYVYIAATGIADVAENARVAIYPNPFSVTSVQLSVGSELVGSTLDVYDDAGRFVFQSQIRNLQSAINLDVASGVYYLRISNAGGSVVRKLVKL